MKESDAKYGQGGVRDLIRQKVQRIKEGPITCPLCRESYGGVSELIRHLKDHCT